MTDPEVVSEISDAEYPVAQEILDWEAENFPDEEGPVAMMMSANVEEEPTATASKPPAKKKATRRRRSS